MILNRNETANFLLRHNEVFSECQFENVSGLKIKTENFMNYIYENIYGAISIDVMDSLQNKEILTKSFGQYKN